MEQLRISCDICEEAGFTDEARFLQKISEQTCKAYLVVERGFEYNDEIYDLNEEASPRQVFLDKTSALREAENQNVAQIRRYNPLAFCYALEEVSSHSMEELGRRITKILAADFQMPPDEEAWGLDPIFPGSATDQQLREIFKLFDRLEFFQVIEAEVSL